MSRVSGFSFGPQQPFPWSTSYDLGSAQVSSGSQPEVVVRGNSDRVALILSNLGTGSAFYTRKTTDGLGSTIWCQDGVRSDILTFSQLGALVSGPFFLSPLGGSASIAYVEVIARR
jgi:hypothetical protein